MDAGEKENARDCSDSGGRHSVHPSVHPGDRNLGLPMGAPVFLMGDAWQDLVGWLKISRMREKDD